MGTGNGHSLFKLYNILKESARRIKIQFMKLLGRNKEHRRLDGVFLCLNKLSMIEECIEEKKDVYELGYLALDDDILY